MPMDFLKRIESAAFPLALSDPSDIRCASVLAAAELVEANLPPADAPSETARAVILRITPQGRAALSKDRGKGADGGYSDTSAP